MTVVEEVVELVTLGLMVVVVVGKSVRISGNIIGDSCRLGEVVELVPVELMIAVKKVME